MLPSRPKEAVSMQARARRLTRKQVPVESKIGGRSSRLNRPGILLKKKRQPRCARDKVAEDLARTLRGKTRSNHKKKRAGPRLPKSKGIPVARCSPQLAFPSSALPIGSEQQSRPRSSVLAAPSCMHRARLASWGRLLGGKAGSSAVSLASLPQSRQGAGRCDLRERRRSTFGGGGKGASEPEADCAWSPVQGACLPLGVVLPATMPVSPRPSLVQGTHDGMERPASRASQGQAWPGEATLATWTLAAVVDTSLDRWQLHLRVHLDTEALGA